MKTRVYLDIEGESLFYYDEMLNQWEKPSVKGQIQWKEERLDDIKAYLDRKEGMVWFQ